MDKKELYVIFDKSIDSSSMTFISFYHSKLLNTQSLTIKSYNLS